jgi:uncharacterized protein
MHDLHAALLALQELDNRIDQAQSRVGEFTPQLDTLEAPVTAAQRELDGVRQKLEELRAEQHRLQRNAQQKQERLAAVQERMNRVRNRDEEQAVRTETDFVRRAYEADAADLKDVSEQATRTDLKLDDLQRQLDRARSEIELRRGELVAQQAQAEAELEALRGTRHETAARLGPADLRLYERVRSGKSRRALAPLTVEGACGQCYNVLPVQEQSMVRSGERLHRCELCGVILYPV